MAPPIESEGSLAAAALAPPSFELEENPSFWKDNNVQVVIRLRPLSPSEISVQGHARCVRQDSCHSITWAGHPESRFTFDLVADEHVSQENLFKVAGVPMVDNCMAGYNSCMFAYGQTGSGKTHTMLGDIENGTRRHSVNCGMTPRVFEYLFSRIQKEKELRREEKLQFVCKCSFLEIYNEQILDLLDPTSLNLQIREDVKKGVHVENLREIEITSARDAMQQLIQGASNRKVAATNMNRASSRSHSVFTFVLESKWVSQGITHHRFSRLNLVDLAGSERQKSSGAEGERLKEATNINKSLSTLGLVITNLIAVSNKKSQHVPYRDSKLTFLLQDSLGGNSKTIIIANISPSSCCAAETLSTLKFAQRAKYIRNNAIVNEDASGDVLSMRLQIQQLKKEVNRLQALVKSERCNSVDAGEDLTSSPGLLKWDKGLRGDDSYSPLIFDKKASKSEDYDAALSAALKSDLDKEAKLKALAKEKHTIEQLVAQRTEEVKGLKMRLRFREEQIKRCQAVASGKLAAEVHLLQEREELVKEMEVLKSQIDRNPEVTKFAMETLQLREELKRLHTFVNEGEREMMHEQIIVLQHKLLDALDWKLMHQKDPVGQELSLFEQPASSEEVEFLRLQAIQNEKEIEMLRKKIRSDLEAKDNLERRVNELLSEIEDLKKHNHNSAEPGGVETGVPTQLELMVDAIAAASHREAETHEINITLMKEIERLKVQVSSLTEDNRRLVEHCQQVGAKTEMRCSQDAEVISQENIISSPQSQADDDEMKDLQLVDLTEGSQTHNCSKKAASFSLENPFVSSRNQSTDEEMQDLELMDWTESVQLDLQKEFTTGDDTRQDQLEELHEENEKLLGLYEKAMEERDEYKRLFMEMKSVVTSPDNLVQLDEVTTISKPATNFRGHVEQHEVLDRATRGVISELDHFHFLERASTAVDEFYAAFELARRDLRFEKQVCDAVRFGLVEAQQKRRNLESKLLSLQLALQASDQKARSTEENCSKAAMSIDASLLTRRIEELSHLQSEKDKILIAKTKVSELYSELRNKVNELKQKAYCAESHKRDADRILFPIENLNSHSNASSFKASDLLKLEEERTKVFSDLKKSRQQLQTVQGEMAHLSDKLNSLDTRTKAVEEEIDNLYIAHHTSEIEVMIRDNTLLEITQSKNAELESWLLDYNQCAFDVSSREEELRVSEEALSCQSRSFDRLHAGLLAAVTQMSKLLHDQNRTYLSSSAGCKIISSC